ncbi:MAG: peptidylprolyl isomerase, partial [Candidatus Latescibacteria bacterium]|nr:peptidylprolyl isomerase [Candidatus Latescibacterota bacterium]
MGTRLVAGLAVCGLVWGCADAPPEDVALLARVGDTEITAEALRAFEAGFDKDEQRARHRANLETLVDREVLLMEARARGLAQAGEVQAELARREVKALADAMLRSQVEERSAATAEEIERAYAEQGWGEKVVAVEMYVLDKEQARQVLDLLARGRDFEEVGREFAADPYYKVLTGEIKRMAYSPFDKPAPVVEAVFGLAVGAVTEPIPLHQGYIIAQVAERRQVALVEVEDGIRAAVEEEKRKQLRQSYLRHLKWDLGTQYNEEGMQLAVEVLQGTVVRQTMSEAQRRTPVYAFEGFEMDVEEVVQAVRPSGNLWSRASADAVNQKLAEDHFPNKIMAHDARRKGLDQSEAFLQSRATALNNL